jgi:hypothetical protein
MRRPRPAVLALPAVLLCAAFLAGAEPQARAVLFYTPTCPYCHEVMERHLPPIQERFGAQLVIIPINVATPEGREVFLEFVEAFEIPREQRGVPALLVGRRVLVGSQEIPEQLPGIVAEGIAAGGIDWPELPLLREYVARNAAGTDTASAQITPGAQPPGPEG